MNARAALLVSAILSLFIASALHKLLLMWWSRWKCWDFINSPADEVWAKIKSSSSSVRQVTFAGQGESRKQHVLLVLFHWTHFIHWTDCTQTLRGQWSKRKLAIKMWNLYAVTFLSNTKHLRPSKWDFAGKLQWVICAVAKIRWEK